MHSPNYDIFLLLVTIGESIRQLEFEHHTQHITGNFGDDLPSQKILRSFQPII